MYKRISVNLIGQLCSFMCNMLIGFLLTPYIVNTLGHETYGFVGLANNFTEYITLFTIAINGMLSRYVTVEYTKKNYKDASGYFSTALIAQGVLAAFLLVPLLFLAVNVNKVVNISPEIVPDVRWLWIMLFVSFLANLPTGCYTVAPFAKNRLEITAVINIAATTTKAAVLLISFVFFKPYVWYIGIATILSNTVKIILSYISKKRLTPELELSVKHFNKKYIGKLLIVGVWNSLNKLQQILYTGLDLLLTNIFINGSEMGLLSIAKTIPTQISTLISTVSNSFDPQMTILYAQKNMKEFLKYTKLSMCLCGFLCSVPIIGFIAFGTQFYSLWVPRLSDAEILKVHILAVLTLLPQVFSVYIFPLYTVNTITTKLRIPVLLSVGIGIVNITVVFILLKTTSLGVYAVAGVSSVLWLLRVFMFVPSYAAWSLGISLKTFYPTLFKGLLNVAVLLCAMGVISWFSVADTWLKLILFCGCAAIVGYGFSFFILFTGEERRGIIFKLKDKLTKGRSVK